jgi:3-deoxy-D-manno-octulosonic-acid transferase
MKFIYNIFIRFYYLFILIGSLFDPKAKQWIKGRKNWKKNFRQKIEPDAPVAWFHAASLGEFEQGRTIIEAFRKNNPDYRLLLTFFSPSGYEVINNYKGADYIFYLPADTAGNARRFIQLARPGLAVFIKYEFWFNYLAELHRKEIPVFFVSAIFRDNHYFFKWYGKWFLKQLRNITMFFVQNHHSLELLRSAGINQAMISGDTRFDRVAAIANEKKENTLVEAFTGSNSVILGGSTWPPDEKLLAGYLNTSDKNVKLIIAPHEIQDDRIRSIEELFGSRHTVRYTQATIEDVNQASVLIIDGMGFLSGLYRYCQVAFIGGGFGKGIHNILEAVTFGKPVLFGPEYQKFNEAVALTRMGGSFPVTGQNDFNLHMNRLLSDAEFYRKTTQVCTNFISGNKGATDIIVSVIEKVLRHK